jgi:hypothetical protein
LKANEDRAEKPRPAIKYLLWVLIAIYTYNLPNARIVYNFLVETIGQELTGRIPLFLVAATGLIYLAILLITRRSLMNLLYLIPCGVIAYVIITLEPNPNKHIHIPEYVLMAWLLFAALSSDDNRGDLLLLIFILTSMLGVVDEVEQGIHPARFYGWSDMLVNSASALIGVLTIKGLTDLKKPDYAWLRYFKRKMFVVWVIGFGVATGIGMGVYLFHVQETGVFWENYPVWLLVSGGALIFLSFMTVTQLLRPERIHPRNQEFSSRTNSTEKRTARQWVLPMLAILVYMQTMIFYIAVSGTEFL